MDEHQPGKPDPLDDDLEVEIELRPPALVATRLLCVATICRRAALELDPAAAAATGDAEGERFDLAAWITEEGLDPFLLPDERQALHLRLRRIPVAEAEALSWQIEGVAVLTWALGYLDDPPAIEAPVDAGDLLAQLPAPWDKTKPVVTRAELLPEAEIAFERERAELWHWRAGVEAEREGASRRELQDLNAAIREVATEAAASGFFQAPVRDDFPVGRTPYSGLSVEERDALAAVATERLRALNWLCGIGGEWDAVLEAIEA